MAQPPTRQRVTYIVKIVAAFRSVSLEILRPKKWVCSRLRKTETALDSMTAKVVVFMPPAVDPGEPPININAIMIMQPVSLIVVRSTVLNPAVLGVTDWKKELQIRSFSGASENSKKKKYAAGIRIKSAVVVRITLLCIRYRFHFNPFVLISSQVINPIPPITINAIMAKFTNGSPTKEVSEEYCCRIPIKSNPALQKAEMEWNTPYQIPFAIPNSRIKEGAMISAPSASKIKVIFKINPVSRTIPPTFGAEIASCMVLRCFKDIFFPETNATATATVTTPIPPI